MKQCPNCKTTYTDDSLQFCLSDGTALVSSDNAAPTVQMSFERNEPMRVNFPPDSAPTVFAQPPIIQKQPEKKGSGKIILGIIGVVMFLAVGGLAAYLLTRSSDNGKNFANATNNSFPSNSPTATPNDETEKLKAEMANLKKQLEDQKKQKPSPTAPPLTANDDDRIAYANSPNDGFLALRDQPDSEAGERIAKIPHGEPITVHSCPKPSNVGKIPGRWCRVTYNGLSGWAFDGFMRF